MRTKLDWNDDYQTGDGKIPLIIGEFNGEPVYEIYDHTHDKEVTSDKKIQIILLERLE